eukprot:9198223-Alexandrium_andersonii.AAC.1
MAPGPPLDSAMGHGSASAGSHWPRPLNAPLQQRMRWRRAPWARSRAEQVLIAGSLTAALPL